MPETNVQHGCASLTNLIEAESFVEGKVLEKL